MTTFIIRMLSFRDLCARLALLVPMLLLLFVAPQASAHTEYVRSDPAAGATLSSAPQQVTIVFSGLLDIAGSSVTVTNASGTTVSEGAATLSPSDQRALVVALQSGLGAGTYTVNWTAMSAEDGHASSSSFTFTVGAAAQPSSATAAQLPATGTSPGSLLLVFVALGFVVAGLGLRAGRFARAAK